MPQKEMVSRIMQTKNTDCTTNVPKTKDCNQAHTALGIAGRSTRLSSARSSPVQQLHAIACIIINYVGHASLRAQPL